MLRKTMNLDGVAVLTKKQLSQIKGGDGPCRIYVRNSAGMGYWSANTYTVDAARFYYEGEWTFSNGFTTTGYCCASCTTMGAPATITDA